MASASQPALGGLEQKIWEGRFRWKGKCVLLGFPLAQKVGVLTWTFGKASKWAAKT